MSILVMILLVLLGIGLGEIYKFYRSRKNES